MPFEYAVLRAVPRVDRGECINVGVVLYCQAADYLDAAVHVDDTRLRMLDPDVDVEVVRSMLDGVRSICAGTPDGGRAAAGSTRARFGWLTSPRSTVVQAGPVHCGLTGDPAAKLGHLLARLVR